MHDIVTCGHCYLLVTQGHSTPSCLSQPAPPVSRQKQTEFRFNAIVCGLFAWGGPSSSQLGKALVGALTALCGRRAIEPHPHPRNKAGARPAMAHPTCPGSGNPAASQMALGMMHRRKASPPPRHRRTRAGKPNATHHTWARFARRRSTPANDKVPHTKGRVFVIGCGWRPSFCENSSGETPNRISKPRLQRWYGAVACLLSNDSARTGWLNS